MKSFSLYIATTTIIAAITANVVTAFHVSPTTQFKNSKLSHAITTGGKEKVHSTREQHYLSPFPSSPLPSPPSCSSCIVLFSSKSVGNSDEGSEKNMKSNNDDSSEKDEEKAESNNINDEDKEANQSESSLIRGISNTLKWWNRISSKPARIIKSFGRGGLVMYGVLNGLWYGLAVAWQWKRVSSSATIAGAAASSAIRASIRKFTTVIATVYIGSQITKLPRMYLAVVLAPFGDSLLRKTQDTLKVSEGAALGIVVSLLLGSCFGIWATIILGDATMASIGR